VTTLTYIFIGILTILIYPDDRCGVDHNMLLIDRAWATPKSAVSELVRAFCGRLRSIRTLATKCCHNDLQRNRQGRGSAQACAASGGLKPDGLAGEWMSELHTWLVTTILPGFASIYKIPEDVRQDQSFSHRDAKLLG
jgi:hypothetical protein